MLTIEGASRKIDCTYGGFMKLREIASRLAGDDVYGLYRFPIDCRITDQASTDLCNRKFSEMIGNIYRRHGISSDALIAFLTEPDAGGSLTEDQCVELASVYDNADEKQMNTSIGACRPTLVRDFVELLCEGAESGGIKWY